MKKRTATGLGLLWVVVALAQLPFHNYFGAGCFFVIAAVFFLISLKK